MDKNSNNIYNLTNSTGASLIRRAFTDLHVTSALHAVALKLTWNNAIQFPDVLQEECIHLREEQPPQSPFVNATVQLTVPPFINNSCRRKLLFPSLPFFPPSVFHCLPVIDLSFC